MSPNETRSAFAKIRASPDCTDLMFVATDPRVVEVCRLIIIWVCFRFSVCVCRVYILACYQRVIIFYHLAFSLAWVHSARMMTQKLRN